MGDMKDMVLGTGSEGKRREKRKEGKEEGTKREALREVIVFINGHQRARKGGKSERERCSCRGRESEKKGRKKGESCESIKCHARLRERDTETKKVVWE